MEERKEKLRKPAPAGDRHAVVVLLAALALCLAAASAGLAQEKRDAAKRMDLNKASANELDKLPEIGPKLAKAIVEFREKSGPFRRVEDLLAVPGISKRRLEKIRPFVFVEGMKKSGG